VEDFWARARERLGRSRVRIIDDAITASPRGAHMAVSVVSGRGERSLIIADEDPGLSDEQKARALDRFWRLDSSRPGTVTMHLTGADSLTGVSTCPGLAATWFRLDAGGWVQGTSAPVSGTGLHWACYSSVDNAGNAEQLRWRSVTILP
jgi:hypothetical protein